MSFDDQSPYQSPQSPYQPSLGKPPGTVSKKPTGLVAISIISLIFGIIGVLNGCCGVIAPFFQDALLNVMDSAVAQGGEETEVQRDAMQAAFAATDSLKIPIILSKMFGLLVSAGLVVGGIAGLKGAPSSRALLAGALLLCVPSRIVDTVVSTVATQRTNAAQTAVYEEAGMGQQMEIMQKFQPIGVAFGIGISVVMVILYAVLGIYIWKSAPIKAYLDSQTSPLTV